MRKRRKPIEVMIITQNPETRDGLQAYLRAAGVNARTTQSIELDALPPPCEALVLFPDDYPTGDIDAVLGALGRREPPIVSIVVTRAPRRFESASAGHVVIPKPVWGWTILDALRHHLGEGRALQ